MRSDAFDWGPVNGDSHEMFEFLNHRWAVGEAKRIIHARPRAVRTLNLATFRSGVGLVYVEDSRIDDANTTVPVICAWGAHPLILFVIDGWARIHRALRDGLDELPMVTLTQRESARVRWRMD
jgi:hypothetical protein